MKMLEYGLVIDGQMKKLGVKIIPDNAKEFDISFGGLGLPHDAVVYTKDIT